MNKEELINGYFEGSLSESQLEKLENLRQTNTDFAADFEFQKELKIALKKGQRSEIKQLFSELNTTKEKTETKVVRMRPWLAAASIAVLVGLGSWLFLFSSSELNTDQLYAANFAPYDNVVHPIERGNELEDLKSRMFQAYETKDYKLYSQLYEKLSVKHKDAYFDFYLGIVQMALENHEKAIPLLKGYINDNGELKDRATWYLALSYLKLGAIEKAENELKNLIQMESFKTKDAQNLLEILD